MIPVLNEIIGLPPATPPAELDLASEIRFTKVLGNAAMGDTDARRELLRLRLAWLNWAYAGKREGESPGTTNARPA